MPGFEFWSDAERKEVNDVLETGILMRYGFDGPAKGSGKPKNRKKPFAKLMEKIAIPALVFTMPTVTAPDAITCRYHT